MNSTYLTETTMILRLVLSFFTGCCIGMERSGRGQIAGLRTHILICVGACGIMMLSIWLPQRYGVGDPARIAAQAVSGMGFLGAGAILKMGADVKGLTTAASIWVIAGIGLTIGAGLYIAGLFMALISLITLSIVNKIELHIFPPRQNKFLEIYFKAAAPQMKDIVDILSRYSVSIISTNIRCFRSEKRLSKIVLLINLPKNTDIRRLINDFEKFKEIRTVVLKDR